MSSILEVCVYSWVVREKWLGQVAVSCLIHHALALLPVYLRNLIKLGPVGWGSALPHTSSISVRIIGRRAVASLESHGFVGIHLRI